MEKGILIKGGTLFALLAIIIGTSIYGLNKEEPEVNTIQVKTETKELPIAVMVEKAEPAIKKRESVAKTAEKIKPKNHHLYVKSNEQIKKEFQQKRMTDRRMYKMREMRTKRLMERKFRKMRNKRKETNA